MQLAALLAVITTSMSHDTGYAGIKSRLLSTKKDVSAAQPSGYSYVENGDIKVGIDLDRGGSIGYMSKSTALAPNLINAHDMGREIQLSFYAGPSFYNPPTPQYPNGACDKLFGGVEWPWNPIGAGDVDGNKGQILNFTKTSMGWHIVTRPLQWACHNVACECTFEQTGTLNGSTLKLVSTLHNNRSDHTVYPAKSQELPAVYTNGPWYKLFTYNGSSPWTNDSVSEYETGFRGPGAKGGAWIPGEFPATENWAALLNEAGTGLGVINPGTTTFLAGFSGKKGAGGTHDNPTGYIAPIEAVTLGPQETYTFVSYMVLGDIDLIRAVAKSVHS